MYALVPSVPLIVVPVLERAATRRWEDAYPYPYIEVPSPNRGYPRGVRRVRMVVWHIADGSYEGALSWLTSPVSRASSTDLISREGLLANIVPGDISPWTNGEVCRPNLTQPLVRSAVDASVNPNLWSYTIECAGRTTAGVPGALTPYQVAGLIIRTAQACMRYKLTADSVHIIRHSDIDGCNRLNCPGYAPSEMVAWITATNMLTRAWRGW